MLVKRMNTAATALASRGRDLFQRSQNSTAHAATMWRAASQSSRGDYAEEALLERQRKAANIAHETRILREELVALRAAMLEQESERVALVWLRTHGSHKPS
jgi:hypothetical protein